MGTGHPFPWDRSSQCWVSGFRGQAQSQEDNPLGVHRFSYSSYKGDLPALPRKRMDRAISRDGRFLAWLTERHGSEGVFRSGDARDELGMNQKTIWRAMESLSDRGVLKIWKSTPVAVDDIIYTPAHTFQLVTRPEFAKHVAVGRYSGLRELGWSPQEEGVA